MVNPPIFCIIGGIIQGVGSLVNGIGNMFTANKQLKQQKEENQKDRDFNHQEAELSRQYNSQMVAEQNQYNSPSAMVNRLTSAGLNPSLAMSGGQLSSVGIGSTSQQASSSGSSLSYNPDLSPFSDAALMAAQVEKTKAETKKIDTDRELTDIEVKYADDIKKGEINLQYLTADNLTSLSNRNDAERNVLAKTYGKLDEEMGLLRAQTDEVCSRINLNNSQKALNLLDYSFRQKTFDDAVSKFQAESSLSRQQADMYLKMCISTCLLNSAMANQANVNATQVQAQLEDFNKRLAYQGEERYKLELDNQKVVIRLTDANAKGQEIENNLKYLKEGTEIARNAIQAIFSFKK